MSSESLFVSIVIPCRNEERFISKCLQGIIENAFPKSALEVFVVDGMSDDRTRSIIGEFCRKYSFISLLDNPKKIVSAALNVGIKNSKGNVILRMDAHSEYPRDYISACIDLLFRMGAQNAGGQVVSACDGINSWSRSIAYVTSHLLGVGNSPFRVKRRTGFVDTVPFGTFRRELFDEIGCFDERLTRNQDNEFNARIRQKGGRIAFDPEIKIFYRNRETLRGLMIQAFDTGVWNVYAFALHPYTWRWRRFVPLFFLGYLVMLFLFPVFFRSGAGCLAFGMPFLLYLGLVGRASFGLERNLMLRMRTAVTFILYHISYGLGTTMGIVNVLSGKWYAHLGKPLRC